jgi:hypothetical protein
LLDLAYRRGEAIGVPVWCAEEAGPYHAIPQPGARWQPEAHPQRLPHAYSRGGTAKLRTLFRPAPGQVGAQGVHRAPNAVRHPWLQATLAPVLAAQPAPPLLPVDHPLWVQWAHWLGRAPTDAVPPLRLILIWDKLAGHATPAWIQWLCRKGVLPFYPPLSGSWVHRAEAVQRSIVRRALAGQHPQAAGAIITWLEETVAGWTAQPTPFVWDGKRRRRRERARLRHLGGSAAAVAVCHPIAA